MHLGEWVDLSFAVGAHREAPSGHGAQRIALLDGDKPARVNPRPGRKLDRRANLEAKLRRSLIVARQFAIDEHDKMLKDT